MRHFWDLLVQWGPPGVFLISAIDSAGVPNPGITDAALILAAIASPANAMLCAALAVAGSLGGAMIFFEIARRGGEKYLLRFAFGGTGLRFREWFLRYGLLTVFLSAFLPLPFLPSKIFMACAGAMGESRLRFLVAMAAGRIPRYFALVYLGATLGEESGAWIKAHLWQMGIFAVALFAGLYVLIRFSARTRLE